MAAPAPSQPTPARKKKAPPALSNAYQKAHKTYVLSAALLASWQLIGIELNTKEKWGVELKSPHAVPLVLLAMIVYFGYRLTVEWMQCDEERRSHRAANLDFVVAHTIAGFALLLSLFQYLLRIRIADIISRASPRLAIFAISSFFVPFALYLLRDILKGSYGPDEKWRQTGALIYSILLLGVWVTLLVWVFLKDEWPLVLLVGTVSMIIGLVVLILFEILPEMMQKWRLARIQAKKQNF